jgi:transmembrane protein
MYKQNNLAAGRRIHKGSEINSNVLDSKCFGYLFRAALTFIFWATALSRVVDFNGAAQEVEQFGLHPAALIAIIVICIQLGGSALVISGRALWLGVGSLAIFTALTIPVAHPFWRMTGVPALHEKMLVYEHVCLIGGLLYVAWSERRERRGASRLMSE